VCAYIYIYTLLWPGIEASPVDYSIYIIYVSLTRNWTHTSGLQCRIKANRPQTHTVTLTDVDTNSVAIKMRNDAKQSARLESMEFFSWSRFMCEGLCKCGYHECIKSTKISTIWIQVCAHHDILKLTTESYIQAQVFSGDFHLIEKCLNTSTLLIWNVHQHLQLVRKDKLCITNFGFRIIFLTVNLLILPC